MGSDHQTMNSDFLIKYLSWFIFQVENWKKKFVLFFNCSNWEKFEVKIWENKIRCLVFWSHELVTGPFWSQKVAILWICSLLPIGHTTVIIETILRAWLITQIWVKWVPQFYRKIAPFVVEQRHSLQFDAGLVVPVLLDVVGYDVSPAQNRQYLQLVLKIGFTFDGSYQNNPKHIRMYEQEIMGDNLQCTINLATSSSKTVVMLMYVRSM